MPLPAVLTDRAGFLRELSPAVGEFKLGRNPELADIVLSDSQVSGVHAYIRVSSGCYTIEDCSTNGTVVNGRRLRRGETSSLRHDDRIQIGSYSLVFVEPVSVPGYDLLEKLGHGGMGVVYKARRLSDGMVLAIKLLRNGNDASFSELARFRIEAEALACLNHPNIIKIRDVGWSGDTPFFAMDFAQRGSLKPVVVQGPQKPRWAVELVRTLALALEHAHQRGMLHRDLKPENVLFLEDGTPLVSDFGLVKFALPISQVSQSASTHVTSALDEILARFARELGAQYQPEMPGVLRDAEETTLTFWQQCADRTGMLGDESRKREVQGFLAEAQRQGRGMHREQVFPDHLTSPGAVMGSPNYMAPEQARGDVAHIGPRTDVYGLGGILYALLTARPPFQASSLYDLLQCVCTDPVVSPRQIDPGLSANIEAICLKCLEKSPQRRYTSAADLAEDLGRFLEGSAPLVEIASPAGEGRVAEDMLDTIPEKSNAGLRLQHGMNGADTP
jgi:serine/threonine-protein kinase